MGAASDRPVTPDPVRLAETVAEARQLLAALGATPPANMGPLFHQHGYAELELALRDLLDALEPDRSGAAAEPAAARTGQ